jgi:hypothetical protein
MDEQSQLIDDFWTHDPPLFDGIFRYYSRDKSTPVPVRAKIHAADEKYYDGSIEIVRISPRSGTRTYVMLHPYVFEPVITLTVGLYDKPKRYVDQEAAIGETVGARQEGVRDVQIGNAQAWLYHETKTLILWECFLESFVRDAPLLNDPNMRDLWIKFEDWLLKQFPQTVTIATPFSDPLFPTKAYQKFLRSLGYEQGDKAAFTKLVR